jgi:AraC-like DNA-binding protein
LLSSLRQGHSNGGQSLEILCTNPHKMLMILSPVDHLYRIYDAAAITPSHSHEAGEFCYAWQGCGLIHFQDQGHLLPPSHGFWIPPGYPHSFSALKASAVSILYLENHPDAGFPCNPTALAVDSLCVGLLSALREQSDKPLSKAETARLLAVLRDRVARLPHCREVIADKLDRRLSPVVLAVFENPTLNHTLGGWARTAGATERTLARLFRRTFGMTFLEWRQRILMDEALRRLQAGEPVTVVALDLGYSTPSAFSHAFHKATGVPPSQFDLSGSANRNRGHDPFTNQRLEATAKHADGTRVLTR